MSEVQEMNIDELVQAFNAIKDTKRELDRKYKEKRAQLDKLEAEYRQKLLAALNAVGAESVRTPYGTVYKQRKVKPIVEDWEEFLDYVRDNDALDLLQRRVAAKAVIDLVEETKMFPPGVRVDSWYDVAIRSK